MATDVRATDTKLIEETAEDLRRRLGDDFSRYHSEQKVVGLVWLATQIVRNGGFVYLYEGYFMGDKSYRETADALETIGAFDAVRAFRDSFAVFPGGVPHEDVDLRNTHYRSQPAQLRERIDGEFFDACPQILRCLAEFIKENRDAIAS
jgi:hypothetical protein